MAFLTSWPSIRNMRNLRSTSWKNVEIPTQNGDPTSSFCLQIGPLSQSSIQMKICRCWEAVILCEKFYLQKSNYQLHMIYLPAIFLDLRFNSLLKSLVVHTGPFKADNLVSKTLVKHKRLAFLWLTLWIMPIHQMLNGSIDLKLISKEKAYIWPRGPKYRKEIKSLHHMETKTTISCWTSMDSSMQRTH